MSSADLTDRDASSCFVALRYWARASQYEPTDQEKAVLTNCEVRSNRLWQAGIAVGGGAGLAAASIARVNLVQRTAVTGAFASAASFYGQYKANRPCLLDIFEAGQSTTSPLDMQARQILREGTTASVQRLQQDFLRQQQQQQQQQQHEPPQQRLPINNSLTGWHAPVPAETTQAEATVPHQQANALATESSVPSIAAPAMAANELGAPPGSSWDAVRQRHQARLAGEIEAPPTPRGRAAMVAAAEPDGTRRAARRNAYGDEILE